MKIPIYISLLLLLGSQPQEKRWTYTFDELNMAIEFPAKSWHLSHKWEYNPALIQYQFALISSDNTLEERAEVWITVKDASDVPDALSFFERNRNAPFSEMEFLFMNQSEFTSIANSIGCKFKARDSRASEKFGSYAVYTIQHGKGVILKFIYSGESATRAKQMKEIMKSVRFG